MVLCSITEGGHDHFNSVTLPLTWYECSCYMIFLSMSGFIFTVDVTYSNLAICICSSQDFQVLFLLLYQRLTKIFKYFFLCRGLTNLPTCTRFFQELLRPGCNTCSYVH